MTTLIHCDGPGCTQTKPDERYALSYAERAAWEAWIEVEQRRLDTLHFHDRACLAAWSADQPGATRTTVTEPATTSPAVSGADAEGAE